LAGDHNYVYADKEVVAVDAFKNVEFVVETTVAVKT